MSSEVVPEGGSSWAETPPMNPPFRHAIGEVVERQKLLDKLANPVQTWLLALVWLSNEDEGIARGSDFTLLLGLLGAAGAAVMGVTDWSALDGKDRRVGFLHGLLNSGIGLLNLTAWRCG